MAHEIPSGLPAAPSVEESPDNWGLALAVLLFFWILFDVALFYLIAWGLDQILLISGIKFPSWGWALVSLVQGGLLAFPLFLLAWFWSGPRYRLLFRGWALGALYFLFLSPLRLLPMQETQGAALAQVILSAFFTAALAVWLHRRGRLLVEGRQGVLLALALAPLFVAPWLIWGSLGSPLDALLNLLAALLLGVAAALIFEGQLLPALFQDGRIGGWAMTLGGFATGALLLIMGTALGFHGQALLLMLALPALGWAVVALGGTWPGRALLIGLAAAAPLTLVDPLETVLILNAAGREILYWAFLALFFSIVIGWGMGLVLFLLRRRPVARPSLPILAGGVATSWGVALLLYFFVGQPGFYGDRLFVILRDQADLSQAGEIADPVARRRYVYETLTTHATESQSELRAALDRSGVPYTPYYLVNALEIEGGPILRFWLDSHPEVDRVLKSPVLRPLPEPAEVASGSDSAPESPPWNLTLIGADRVWEEFEVRGEGVVIGQSDSGVQGDHPELAVTYRGRDGEHDYNWFDPWNGSREPVDIGGHGTHTLGSIVGERTGVAPDAEWIGCVNLARNLANPAFYLDCLQFMLAPFPLGGDPFVDGDPARAADVLNNSWGCPDLEGCDPTALQPAVEALRAAGIFVVASAGNEGMGGCATIDDPPALYDAAFSVGAVDANGQLAEFSSLGPVTVDGSGRVKPDIVAPGVDVLSAFPNSSYAAHSGTSMAGPHVAGVVALLWSANPALVGDIERTEQILIESAQPYEGMLPVCVGGGQRPNNGVGYGLVDAYSAVQRALEER